MGRLFEAVLRSRVDSDLEARLFGFRVLTLAARRRRVKGRSGADQGSVQLVASAETGPMRRQPLWPPNPKEFDSEGAGSQRRG